MRPNLADSSNLFLALSCLRHLRQSTQPTHTESGERWDDRLKTRHTNYCNCLPDTQVALPQTKRRRKNSLSFRILVNLLFPENISFCTKKLPPKENKTRPRRVTALRVVVASVHVGNVGLHHVLHKLLEGDLRHPAKLLLRLGAVTLKNAERRKSETTNNAGAKVDSRSHPPHDMQYKVDDNRS